MKHFARLVLRLVTVSIPVFIAACYGMPYRYSRAGRVIDRDTHAPISGIEVSCVGKDGRPESGTYSGEDGSFLLSYDEPCARVSAVDVDGDQNGKYHSASVPFSAQDGEITILMTLAR